VRSQSVIPALALDSELRYAGVVLLPDRRIAVESKSEKAYRMLLQSEYAADGRDNRANVDGPSSAGQATNLQKVGGLRDCSILVQGTFL